MPANAPWAVSAASAITPAPAPWPSAAAAHAHLRRAMARMRAAVNSCGNSAPASRIGTRKPIIAAGAPRCVISHDSTSLGSTNPSADLFSPKASA